MEIIKSVSLTIPQSDQISSYGIQDSSSSFRKIAVLVGLVFLLGLIASILGVCFAVVSLCARKQRQDSVTIDLYGLMLFYCI